jgi:hypothetical protein
MGQRFLIDSFVTGQVVWPFVPCTPPPRGRCRLLPDPLDVLYCLGNDDALPLLQEEIETFEYAPNLSALRYIIDNQEPDVWQESLYNSWLQAIRTLAKTGRGENLPAFMRTGAWQQEKMNTQLAAWAEIRHDNLLYGKQSFSGFPVSCSVPRTYVEPIPAFYEALEHFAGKAGSAFSGIPEMPESIPAFFSYMERTMTWLREIAEKELDGRPFTDEERAFLQAVLYKPEVPCEEGGAGWYRRLYFGAFALDEEPGLRRDALIADIHTDPGRPSRVLHVATGDPELGVFVAAARGYPLTAYVGPVASYHEHVTYDFERLTDQEWDQLYRNNPPARPDWTYVYLADREGAIRQGGRLLVAEPDSFEVWADSTGCPPDSASAPNDSIDNQQGGDPWDQQDDPGENEPETELKLPPAHLTYLSIMPNPAPRDVLVSLRLEGQDRVPVRLRVLDSRGAFTREIYDGWLSPQLTHFQWDCKDNSGRCVESGVYFLQVKIGNTETTRKITVVR